MGLTKWRSGAHTGSLSGQTPDKERLRQTWRLMKWTVWTVRPNSLPWTRSFLNPFYIIHCLSSLSLALSPASSSSFHSLGLTRRALYYFYYYYYLYYLPYLSRRGQYTFLNYFSIKPKKFNALLLFFVQLWCDVFKIYIFFCLSHLYICSCLL